MDHAPQPPPSDGEKRRFPRAEQQVPLQYQVSINDQWVQGQGQMEAVDIGAGGMQIRVNLHLTADSTVYFHVPLEDGPIYALARVVWVRPDAERPAEYLAGVEFLNLPPADRERLDKAFSSQD
jgi:c-di-GMP-binding flagellar brake protein YcgR